jgi:hypothetical protein
MDNLRIGQIEVDMSVFERILLMSWNNKNIIQYDAVHVC